MSNEAFIQTCASRCTLTIEQLSERIERAELNEHLGTSISVSTPDGYPDYWLTIKTANKVLEELFLSQ